MIRSIINKIKTILRRRKRLTLYIISGVSSLIIDYVTFITFYYVFRAPIAVAAPVGLSAGLVVSFLLNKLLTFKDRAQSGRKQTVIQATLYMALFLFNNIFTVFFIRALFSLGISVALGKLIATGTITIWNYVIYKKIIFKQKNNLII